MNAADDRVPLVFEDTASARDVFLAWEKLRLVYNAALVLATLAGMALNPQASFLDRSFLRLLLYGSVVANVLYCAGPVAEGYLAWMGAPRRSARAVVFTLGCVLGATLAFVCVVFWRLFDGFD